MDGEFWMSSGQLNWGDGCVRRRKERRGDLNVRFGGENEACESLIMEF